jgi:hypothetical protein
VVLFFSVYFREISKALVCYIQVGVALFLKIKYILLCQKCVPFERKLIFSLFYYVPIKKYYCPFLFLYFNPIKKRECYFASSIKQQSVSRHVTPIKQQSVSRHVTPIKQQSVSRHVTPIKQQSVSRHSILIQIKPIFALSP